MLPFIDFIPNLVKSCLQGNVASIPSQKVLKSFCLQRKKKMFFEKDIMRQGLS